jgi:gluconate 2-dehydrogenase gamma chain
MSRTAISRRSFLANSLGSAGSAWLIANLPAIRAAAQHAHAARQTLPPARFEFFSPAQAASIEAITAQIIPTDDTAGARDAGVVYFIDRVLTTFDKDKQQAYVKGLANLSARIKKAFGKTEFAELSSAEQVKALKSIERTGFFQIVREHTIVGFLADPSYGGNRDMSGWKAIGFEDSFVYKPPFGFYDRDYKENR